MPIARPEPLDGPDESELDAVWAAEVPEPVVGYGRPPVVAVIVTKDPGPWFEEALGGLAEQDYDRLSVLVVDNGSAEDPTARIADVLPAAFVKRLPEDRGYSAAANEALTAVEGATFLLFLHDDVRLHPGAVTSMVAEAFRMNAGVVGPKLVGWDDPTELRSVGYSVDKFGSPTPYAEPGELDQAQHDSPREVFGVSSAALLIRDDLMRTIGGFDDRIGFFGEDVDLCWRARIAGAAVVVAPTAVARHREAFGERGAEVDRHRLELRHQGRVMVTSYTLLHLMRVVPQGILYSIGDFLAALLSARGRAAMDVLAAWGWNLANLPNALGVRGRVARFRRTSDPDVRALQRRGSARLTMLWNRRRDLRVGGVGDGSRQVVSRLADEGGRWPIVAGLIAVVIVVLGTRGLITGPIPGIREFLVGTDDGGLRDEWWSGWRTQGMGAPGAAPGIVGLLGVLGAVSLGLAARLLVLAPIVLGAIGAWRFTAATGSPRARAAAVVVYVGLPVPWNAVAEGRLAALAAYAAAPWVLRMVARDAGLAPFAASEETARVRPAPVWHTVVRLGLILGFVAMVAPVAAAVVILAATVCHIGQLLVGDTARLGSVGLRLAGASVVAVLMNLPWLVSVGLGGDRAALLGALRGNTAAPTGTELLTLSTGPVAAGWFGVGVLLAAGASLFAARGRRLGWALGGWLSAGTGWGLAIIGSAEGGMPLAGGVELVLVPVVLGLTLSVAMAGLAIERDVLRSDFGAGQIAAVVATVGVLVAILPTAVAAVDGRWYLPERGLTEVVAAVEGVDDARILWIGDPDVLPAVGWPLDEAAAGGPEGLGGITVAVTDGLPDHADRHRLAAGPADGLLRATVGQAVRGGTSRLGRVLAGMGIRFVAVPDRPGPSPSVAVVEPRPTAITEALSAQVELQRLVANEAVTLFEVQGAALTPYRVDAASADLDADPAALVTVEVADAPHVLVERRSSREWSGSLEPAEGVLVAPVANDAGWRLEGAPDATPRLAFGWARAFEVGDGDATLQRPTPPIHLALVLWQVLAVLVLLALAGRVRRRTTRRFGRPRRRERPEPVVVVTPGDDALEGLR